MCVYRKSLCHTMYCPSARLRKILVPYAIAHLRSLTRVRPIASLPSLRSRHFAPITLLPLLTRDRSVALPPCSHHHNSSIRRHGSQHSWACPLRTERSHSLPSKIFARPSAASTRPRVAASLVSRRSSNSSSPKSPPLLPQSDHLQGRAGEIKRQNARSRPRPPPTSRKAARRLRLQARRRLKYRRPRRAARAETTLGRWPRRHPCRLPHVGEAVRQVHQRAGAISFGGKEGGSSSHRQQQSPPSPRPRHRDLRRSTISVAAAAAALQQGEGPERNPRREVCGQSHLSHGPPGGASPSQRDTDPTLRLPWATHRRPHHRLQSMATPVAMAMVTMAKRAGGFTAIFTGPCTVTENGPDRSVYHPPWPRDAAATARADSSLPRASRVRRACIVR